MYKKVFPASDKVFENNYCLTKVALYEIRIISSIQLYIIECNCIFLSLFYGLILQ